MFSATVSHGAGRGWLVVGWFGWLVGGRWFNKMRASSSDAGKRGTQNTRETVNDG